MIIEGFDFDYYMAVDCPHCGFRWGYYKIDNIKPDRPVEFICLRDRGITCGSKWDVAVTEEQYKKRQDALDKVVIIKKLIKEVKRVLR